MIDNGAIQAGWLRIWADTPGEGSDLDADLLLFLTIILLGERDELLLFLVLLSLSGRHYSVLGRKRIRTGYVDEAIGDVSGCLPRELDWQQMGLGKHSTTRERGE